MKFARRLFLIIFTVSALLGSGGTFADPFALLGWDINADLKSWTPLPIAFTSLEIGLIVVAVVWLLRDAAQKRKHPFVPGALFGPMLWLCAALVVGVLWGMLRGSVSTTIVGFELRGFAMLVMGYLMVGMLLRDERDLAMVVRGTLIACTGLALDNLYRFYVVLGSHIPNDLAYDHDDSVVLGFGFILCLALLAFRGTRGQRLWAGLLLPLTIWCMMIMQRRAAFAVLGIGCVILAILLYRLRPKVFWRTVPVLSLILGAYLVVFWHSESTIGQPARAISSLFSPDPRDAASNQYRDIERIDIINNIRSSRVLGLGFGQAYTMYWPLPDLSFWPFWHFETHNSDLWIWMDGGVPVFFTFWLVIGIGSYVGGRELARRREEWSLAQVGLRRRGNRRVVGVGHRMHAQLVHPPSRARAVAPIAPVAPVEETAPGLAEPLSR
ncbi:MAG TPA: O-antigen ligase family protein, partial [Ktedonobacterales bacterium]|nr:O-antigen ligase family protein [Ktedonobacterales bacterium]